MLQKTTDRVLICLPDGRWVALSADLFQEALRSGAELAASKPTYARSLRVTIHSLRHSTATAAIEGP